MSVEETEFSLIGKDKDEFKNSGVKVIGIVGLGLIGGSFAKAFKRNADVKILAANRSKSTVELAMSEGVVDGELTKDNIGECDLIIPALYNQAVIDYITEMAPYIRKDAIVIDAGGLKRRICKECTKIADKYGFTFVGGHPMAGKKYSGYKYSSSKLFNDASMIIVPKDMKDKELIKRLRLIFSPCGFARLTVTSAENHDSMIAFTSEMAHIVSNAYIKSPTARKHRGFSAGSYKDMTRVAWLNEDMWTEIFMENKDNLIYELDTIIGFLGEYKEALETDDAEKLHQILHEGKIAKEEVDGK